MSLTIEQVNAGGAVTAMASGRSDVTLVTPAYAPGDKLVFHTEDARYVWVKIHETVAEAMIFVPGRRVFISGSGGGGAARLCARNF